MLSLAAVACDDASVPGPGSLTATLVGPNGPEGAAIVVVYGGGVTGFNPAPATRLFAASNEGEDVHRLVLINPRGGPIAFELSLADTLTPPSFGIEQVAGPDDALRENITTYSVELTR